jgi:hypothetical protein
VFDSINEYDSIRRHSSFINEHTEHDKNSSIDSSHCHLSLLRSIERTIANVCYVLFTDDSQTCIHVHLLMSRMSHLFWLTNNHTIANAFDLCIRIANMDNDFHVCNACVNALMMFCTSYIYLMSILLLIMFVCRHVFCCSYLECDWLNNDVVTMDVHSRTNSFVDGIHRTDQEWQMNNDRSSVYEYVLTMAQTNDDVLSCWLPSMASTFAWNVDHICEAKSSSRMMMMMMMKLLIATWIRLIVLLERLEYHGRMYG